MKMRLGSIFILCLFAVLQINAQRYNLGVRAGMNYSKINGPSEEGMMQGSKLNNGINFGITFAYKFTEKFGLKTELGYSNIGSTDSIVGQSFYNFGIGTANQIREGYIKKNLEISNSYINLPMHAYFYPIKKLEIFGGPYVSFLINPSAAGRLLFDDQNEDTKFGFIQTLDYDYYSDNARDVGSTRSLFGGETLTVIVDEQVITMPRIVGAYYQFSEKDGNLYKWFDWGLSMGAHYYINKSFYMGARIEYGLFDITRTKMDVAYRELNGGQYILRDDRDTNLSIQASVGFKF